MNESSKLAQEMREAAAMSFGTTTYHQWHEIWDCVDNKFDKLLAPLREECDELHAQMNRINLRHGDTVQSLVKMNIELREELKVNNEMIESLVEEVEEEERNVYELSTELKNNVAEVVKLLKWNTELRDSDKVLKQRLKECREDLAVVDKDRGDLRDEVERLQKSIDFDNHLKKASRIVDAWPDWKKNVLLFPDVDSYPEEVETALLEFRSKDQTEIERLKGAVKVHKEVCDDALTEVAVLKECISDHECGNKLLNDMIVTLAQHNDELEEEEEEEEEIQEPREYHDVVVSILAPLLEGVDKVRFSIKSVIRSQELAMDQHMEALDKRDDALVEIQKQQDFIEYLLGDVDSSEAWEEFNESEKNE